MLQTFLDRENCTRDALKISEGCSTILLSLFSRDEALFCLELPVGKVKNLKNPRGFQKGMPSTLLFFYGIADCKEEV